MWTHFWEALRRLGFRDNIVASCQFGSIHKKEFDFLLYLFDCIEAKCPGCHSHVKIEGKWTKGSATYHPELGLYLAKAVRRAVLRVRRLENDEVEVLGLESLVVNDLMIAKKWDLEKAWTWKKTRSHINVLESFSSVAALSLAASREPDTRVPLVVDSQVARGALSKGRSSSFSLQPGLKRACAVQLAFGLFPAWTFCPTRPNCADDGSRGVETRGVLTLASIVDFLDFDSLVSLHGTGLKRFAANWIRLVVLALIVCP